MWPSPPTNVGELINKTCTQFKASLFCKEKKSRYQQGAGLVADQKVCISSQTSQSNSTLRTFSAQWREGFGKGTRHQVAGKIVICPVLAPPHNVYFVVCD